MTALNSVGNLRVDAAVAAATSSTVAPTPVASSIATNPLLGAAVQVAPTGTAGAATAAQGAAATTGTAAAAAQPAATQPKAEAYNAPVLDLPDEPTTQDVLVSITRAMASPGVNETTINTLKELQSSLFDSQKQMITEVLNGMVS
ncbi:MAG: hypothetical protein JWN72_1994 [Thermoleophilia bacterium]|nr:hypothetical protein [Thermoleophilia bacterium]